VGRLAFRVEGYLMGMGGGSAVPDDYEIAVDYMDMNNDRHLWARAADARPGLELSVGRHVVVGDEDADPKRRTGSVHSGK
jgi:hypothetical protein